MNEKLDGLLSQYERGHLTRRQFLTATSALVATSSALAAPAGPLGKVETLNHVTMFVRDVQKSVRFYQELFDMPVLSEQSPGVNLSAGSGFLGIYPAQQNAIPAINHVCFGLRNFDADATLKQLTDRGLQANIRMRGETKELYFNDPDNIRMQLQDIKYKGGGGVLGDK
jgi:catechol 2,3-dioxygenase-like lactoylglutathione lyase family enzyme